MKAPQEVVVGLFMATDERNWDQVKGSFNAQVTLDYSSMNGNPASELTPDQIVDAWKGILPGFESTHHQIGNIMTSVTGDKAHVFCYGTASHYLQDDGGNLWTVVGTYDFELIKNQAGMWKIDAMKFNFKFQSGNTSLPQKAIDKLK